MALLNPPELRPSVTLSIVRYLGAQRAQQENIDRLFATLAPMTLDGNTPQRDVSVNLTAAIELGLIIQCEGKVSLTEGMLPVINEGDRALLKRMRSRIFDNDLNSGSWRSQVGARDLTNALAWFLTFAPADAPTQMEGGARSAEALQARDFGPRQDEKENAPSNWPIGNNTRWIAFRRWACSLGFAWVDPKGNLVPDPTVAIRDALPDVFEHSKELTASEFVRKVGDCIPVLDGGRYRTFVESNWKRGVTERPGLTMPMTDALERLTNEGSILVDDRHDIARVAKADGSTFSHVRIGVK